MIYNLISQHPFVAALFSIAILGILFGALLGYAAVRFKPSGNSLEDQINDILPQTQCGQCGYPGCRPYANAIANEDAPINRCPPGGETGIKALAALLDTEPLPLDAEHGEEKPRAIAYIREDECIGCTLCIQACPVDAIMGTSKAMHTVISAECTGCDLCVDPCPVDCIEMRVIKTNIRNWSWSMPREQLIASDRWTQISTER
jgi:electron transport complex protein RnfB